MQLLFFAIISSLLIFVPLQSVFAEHIFEDNQAFAQYLDISQLSSSKITLEIGDNSYDVYYGFHGSLEIDIEDLKAPLPVVSSMQINQERKSLEIAFSDVPLDSVFWVRIPFEVMTAENEQYQLFVDGKETKFDRTKFPSDYSIGMILPKDSKHVEIIGTNVIPEFGIFSSIVLGISISALVLLFKRNPKMSVSIQTTQN